MPNQFAVISSNPADLEFLNELALVCSFDLKAQATFDGEALKASIGQGHTCFIDASIPGVLKEAEALGFKKIELSRLHWICPPEDKALLGEVFDSPVAQNIVFRKYGTPMSAAESYAHVVKSSYLKSSFGLQSLFGEAVQVDSVKFNESIERGFVAQALSQQLTLLGYNELIIPAVSTAVDELLMNAIFDAPVDENGKQIYARQSRNINIKLVGKQNIEMQVGGFGDFIGVTVVDHFGSLDSAAVKQHIAKSFNGRQDDERDESLAGAGLGLSLILKRGGSLLYIYKPGERTDATVFFRRSERLKEFNRQFQFVCLRQLV